MKLQLFCCYLYFWLWLPLASVSATSGGIDPYAILKVAKDASDADIRRQYKKQCLQNHPDKNMGKPEKEAKLCEERFKMIQKANGLIGEPESRRLYDNSLRFGGSTSYNGYQRSDQQAAQDFFQAFYGQHVPRKGARRGGAGVYVSPDGGFNVRFNGGILDELVSALFRGKTNKSRYTQHIKIPLKDLYSGKANVAMLLKDSPWKRYLAAIRGGFAGPLCLSSLLVSLSTMQAVRYPFNFVVGLIYFHLHVPKPSTFDYKVDIKAGWKAGTKLTFRDVEPGFEVDFIVEEDEDECYGRIGNDLHTTLTITSSEATRGGTIMMEHLDGSEVPVQIPKGVTQSGDQIVLKGQGWPRKADNGAGDLIVTIKIASKRKKKMKRSKK